MAKLNARPVSFHEKIFDRSFDKAKMLARMEKRSVRQEDARLVGLRVRLKKRRPLHEIC